MPVSKAGTRYARRLDLERVRWCRRTSCPFVIEAREVVLMATGDRHEWNPGSSGLQHRAIGAPAGFRTNGSLVWFNEAKNVGAIDTDDGERIRVDGAGFPEGKGIGRCHGTKVTFDVVERPEGRTAVAVSLVPIVVPRRARRRRGY
jgi:cold shock CspA family protein